MNLDDKTPLLLRSWYFSDIAGFLHTSDDVVLSRLVRGSSFPVTTTQKDAWIVELLILRTALQEQPGRLYLEFTIPRMGHRVDAVILINGVVFALEFKIGSREFLTEDIDQAYDYAMDLKYFHEASHDLPVVPVLVATDAKPKPFILLPLDRVPGLYETVCVNGTNLKTTIQQILATLSGNDVDAHAWETSRYCPTPTIIEAARALYAGHGVADISRNDAGAINLRDTSAQLVQIIEKTRKGSGSALDI